MQRLLGYLFAALWLSSPALATWSIVALNKVTGEVCVASATCIDGNFPLKRYLPVVVVDKGAAAAQSFIDTGAFNRKRIWNHLHAGADPQSILDLLESTDSQHETRQYGIVSFTGAPVTFTGSLAGAAKFGVVGEVGDIVYAIQGNVLTGDIVVTEAEAAFVAASGDLGQRVMAGMEAARAFGGDGRCSCSQSQPTSCGAPPPNFTKSAHTAFIVLARRGDRDGECNSQDGCSTGNYFMTLVEKGVSSDPDPIPELQAKYDTWRAGLADHADGVTSIVSLDRHSLPADGFARAYVDIEMRDIEGQALTAGGHKFQLRPQSGGPDIVMAEDPIDLGGGIYRLPLRSTGAVGSETWLLRCKRPGDKWVAFADPLTLRADPVTELHIGADQLGSAGAPFLLNLGPAEAGRPYRLLGSASGTSPGTSFGGLTIPLNADRFYRWSWSPGALFEGHTGALGNAGRAEAWLHAPKTGWGSLSGSTLHFCAMFSSPSGVSNVVSVEVTP